MPSVSQRLLAEAIGAFALVFAGCGAIMVDAKTHALGHLGVALSFGLVIMVMISALGHISGAHFNPAVTLDSHWGDTSRRDSCALLGGATAGRCGRDLRPARIARHVGGPAPRRLRGATPRRSSGRRY